MCRLLTGCRRVRGLVREGGVSTPVQQQMGAAHPVPWEASPVDRGCHGGGDGRTQGARRDHQRRAQASQPQPQTSVLCVFPSSHQLDARREQRAEGLR